MDARAGHLPDCKRGQRIAARVAKEARPTVIKPRVRADRYVWIGRGRYSWRIQRFPAGWYMVYRSGNVGYVHPMMVRLWCRLMREIKAQRRHTRRGRRR